MNRSFFIALFSLLTVYSSILQAQTVISDLTGNGSRGVVTSLEHSDTICENSFAADGIIQDWQNTYEDFENTVFSDLTGYIKQLQQKKLEEKQRREPFRQITTPDGTLMNLPQLIDENGVDLFYLTENGISIYLLLNPPSFFTDDADMSAIIKWVRYYAYEKRFWTQKKLKRYSKMSEAFQQAFNDKGIPPELTLLTIQESGCNPNAVSRAGAAGVWQFMPATARKFGLTVNQHTDERHDTYKAAKAAASLLKSNHRNLGNWTLALAAYNCGAAKIQAAIKKADGDQHWENIEKYLPDETRNYIPGIIALYYIWTYREQLGFS